MHARDTAVPFYEKLGYLCCGEPFEEVGIAHIKMQKQLSPLDSKNEPSTDCKCTKVRDMFRILSKTTFWQK